MKMCMGRFLLESRSWLLKTRMGDARAWHKSMLFIEPLLPSMHPEPTRLHDFVGAPRRTAARHATEQCAQGYFGSASQRCPSDFQITPSEPGTNVVPTAQS